MNKLSGAMTSAIAANGKSLAQQITDEACALIVKQIPDMIERITDGTLSELRKKIDSEQFSEKFVNVLQQKLIDGKPPDDPFLNKFIKLFDNVIEKAINNHSKPINVPPQDITTGIADYLQKNESKFWEPAQQELYTAAAEKVLSEFNTQPGQSPSAFIEALKMAVTSEIMGSAMFENALNDTIKNYKPKPSAPVVEKEVPATGSSNSSPEVTAAAPEVTESKPNQPGGRSKRTRKVSRNSKSRRNRRNRPNVLTKRNLFL
jgi:hypothetical protein